MRLAVVPIDAEIHQLETALKINAVPMQNEVSSLKEGIEQFQKNRNT
jgi:hypothetical protein